MQEREGRLIGDKNLSIYWQSWLPEQARALVVIAHGAAEHGGRYARLAQALDFDSMYALQDR